MSSSVKNAELLSRPVFVRTHSGLFSNSCNARGMVTQPKASRELFPLKVHSFSVGR
jgi:hypothetical protein